jgi:hypothetical protein
VLAAKAIQNDTDLLLGRILLAGRSANIPHDPLGRQFGGSGFLAHLHSSMVAISQKSSLPQTLTSVSKALTPDSWVLRTLGEVSSLIDDAYIPERLRIAS